MVNCYYLMSMICLTRNARVLQNIFMFVSTFLIFYSLLYTRKTGINILISDAKETDNDELSAQ